MYMKEARRESEVLSVHHMIRYIIAEHDEWWASYRDKQKDEDLAYSNLARMCRRFAYKNGFGRRVATFNKLKEVDLESIKASFSAAFWKKFPTVEPARLINIDETGIFVDMPPRYILVELENRRRLTAVKKNSGRITATLGIKANGMYRAV